MLLYHFFLEKSKGIFSDFSNSAVFMIPGSVFSKDFRQICPFDFLRQK